MKYARIINNYAIDVREVSPEGYFTPNIAAEFIQVPDTVENGWILNNGEWLAPEPLPNTPEPLPPIEVLRQQKLTEVKYKADEINTRIKAPYAIFEIDSFSQQEAEAVLVIAGQSLPEGALLPILVAGENEALAEGNKITLLHFAERILQNVKQAKAATEAILYQLRAYETAIKQATTVEQLQVITVDYTLTAM